MTTETEAYVQPRRSDYGRNKVFYSPRYVAKELAAIVKRSPLWAEASTYMDPETDEITVRDHEVENLANFGQGRGFGSDSWYMEIRRSFSVEGSIHIRRHVAWTNGDTTVLAEGGRVLRIYPCTYEVQVNWSSTHRSIATAQASIALYQALTDLGATLQAKVEEYNGTIAELVEQTPPAAPTA